MEEFQDANLDCQVYEVMKLGHSMIGVVVIGSFQLDQSLDMQQKSLGENSGIEDEPQMTDAHWLKQLVSSKFLEKEAGVLENLNKALPEQSVLK